MSSDCPLDVDVRSKLSTLGQDIEGIITFSQSTYYITEHDNWKLLMTYRRNTFMDRRDDWRKVSS